MTLRGNANQLMDAAFTYNVPKWKPEVAYTVKGGIGRLSVKQPGSYGSIRGKKRCEWDVRLKNGVPIDLSVDTGVVTSKLDLNGLDLSSLKLDTGTGSLHVGLKGSYPSLAQVDLDSGVGDVSLHLTGRYPALKTIRVDGGTGDIRVDLTGEWKHGAAVTIDSGVGKISLRLPKDIGVRVAVSKGVGKVSGTGMRMDGEDFVNDAYGGSGVTLDIRIKQGVGDITLDLEK